MHELKNSIRILDNVVPVHHRAMVYNYVSNSNFRIGWSDRPPVQGHTYSYLHSRYSDEDVKNIGLLPLLNGTEFGDVLKDYDLTGTTVNMSVPSNVHFVHGHFEDLVLLYYVNPDWQPHFYGETVFFNKDCSDIVRAVPFTPGRFVLFDGTMPHSIRPQSSAGPDYRFTISFMYTKKAES